MTASELLGISRPEDLFPGDPVKLKVKYRELAKQWHPDAGGNTAVFAHITSLYDSALDRLSKGVWEGSAVLTYEDATGGLHTFTIRASAPFELGQSLVGDDHVLYLIDPEHLSIVFHLINRPLNFRFASDEMRQEASRYLPAHLQHTMLSDGRMLVQMDKTPDLLRLRDVVTHLGTLDPKHTAWVVSSLLNLACYLEYTGIVHHDISLDTYFISPQHHSGALLGGWWYARERGERVDTVPLRTFSLLPFKVKVTKRASALTNLELIRATARECLTKAPEPMQSWLYEVSAGSAVEQYRAWMGILEKTFGPRKFTAMLLNADAVYGTKGTVHHG
jgi:hypothetical protein